MLKNRTDVQLFWYLKWKVQIILHYGYWNEITVGVTSSQQLDIWTLSIEYKKEKYPIDY